MQTKVANLPDRPVRYLEAGSGRPVLFLHAFPLSADQWLPQLSRVPRGWRFVAPDFRGFRGGGRPSADVGLDGATMDRHASDVLALMTHLGIGDAVIAGLSMGGYVAFALLRQAPARVGGLVLANTRAAADSAEAQQARDRMIALARREGVPAVATEMVPRLLGETTMREQPDLVEAVRHLIESNSVEGVVSAIRALKLRQDSTALLSSIACPTLVIAGDEDKVVPSAEAQAMHEAIAGAAFVLVSRTGHLSNLEAAATFNDALGSFLQTVGRPAA